MFRTICQAVLLGVFALLLASCGGGGSSGGSGGGGAGNGNSGNADTVAPNISHSYPPSSAFVSSLATLDLTFSEPVIGADVKSNYTVSGAGAGTLAIAGVTAISSTQFQISLSGVVGNGNITISLSNITDLAGNALSNPVIGLNGPPLAYAGFNFNLSTGDYWEYAWDYYELSSATGSSPTTTNDSGRFWVVLGQPTTIQGVTAYAVQLYGKGKNSSTSFFPRWKYLALANNQMSGSTDGVSLVPFFDAELGKWPGGGFFTTLPASTLSVATSSIISSTNTYISGSAIVAGRSASQSQCQYFQGIGNICGDSAYNYTENEYFRPNVGPVGYYYNNSYSSCGGGFCSGASWKHNVGLTASSFTGQSSPLVNEAEPNDTPFASQTVNTGNVAIGVVSDSAIANLGNTVINVSVIPDGASTPVTIQPAVEDWYTFTLASTKTVTITLVFQESPNADLDLFLMNSSASTLLGYSVHDNVLRKDQTETITMSLAAGTYRIGVDGYLTPAPVTYTLHIQ